MSSPGGANGQILKFSQTSADIFFGVKKNGKQSTQFRPYLKVNNAMVPTDKLNDSFVYLGKEFCDMSSENVKRYLVKTFGDYLEKIDILSLHPKHKINILTKCLQHVQMGSNNISSSRNLDSTKSRQQSESIHPNIIVIKDNIQYAIELTACFETNFFKKSKLQNSH